MAQAISDAEMQAHLASGRAKALDAAPAPQASMPGAISDEEMQSHLQSGAAKPADEQEGLLGRAVNKAEDIGAGILKDYVAPVIAPIGRFVDKYTGAPTRAAAQDIIQGKGLSSAASRFGSQFGEDPETAPTGKKLAQELGASEKSASDVLPSLYSDTGNEWTKFKRGGLLDPTASGAAGLGLDVALDPTNLIPVGAIAKGAGKAIKGAGKLGLELGEGLARGGAKLADVATGTELATKGLEGTESLVRNAADAISHIATPQRVENFDKLAQTAQSIGIKPEELSAAAEFGKSSTASRMERHIAEGPVGGKLLDAHEKVASKIAYGVDQTIQKLGGGQVLDPVGAGELLKNGYANAEKHVLKDSELTYKTASQLSPNLQIIPEEAEKIQTAIDGLKKRAVGYMQRGATKDQVAMGRDLLGFANRVEKNGTSYKQLADQIGFIGEAMTEPTLNRVHARELRNFYKTLSGGLINTVKDLAPDLGEQLVENNKTMSNFFKSRDAVGTLIQNSKSNPETVFKSMTSDASKIDELKNILSPQEFDAFRASYMNSLIKKNADGFVLYDSATRAIKGNKGRLARMFNDKEISELGDLLELGHAQGTPVLSTSGTGASSLFSDIKHGIAGGLINEKVLNKMKNRGRGLLTDAAEAVPEAASNIARPASLSEATMDVGGLLNGLKRGPIERRLKAAQSYAPQTYEERR